mmetsp:Transcript_54883/g.117779  ORF Transcript_54883/g.117779 Transcript_54883/m.117779 type:complete len:322 (+) Transcript_54883:86-1051(+)
MGLEEVRLVPICCCGCCCFWVIFTIIAVPLSFKSLEQGKYALQLSWMSQKIADEVVTEPGMKMVGLGNMLIEYPSTFQYMYFANVAKSVDEQAASEEVIRGPIRARSEDGLDMKVSLSFQWKLEPQALHPLYGILGDNLYKDEFVRFARASVVEACSKFRAGLFFTNRTEITAVMLDHLSSVFKNPSNKLSVNIQGLQLREVDLPDAFDDEIVNTQEQMQEAEVAMAEREQQKIAMERELLVATEKVQEVIQNAKGAAEQVTLNNQAVVDQMLIEANQKALANAEVLQLFINDADPFGRLFNIMQIRALGGHKEDKLLINM